MKPIIAIESGHYATSEKGNRFDLPEDYVVAVEKAGGMPLLLPPSSAIDIPKLFSQIDGVILTGGDDFPGEYFQQPHQPMALPNTERRQSFSLEISKALVSGEKPFLAICLGCQSINIAMGGTLYIDVPDEIRKSSVVHRRSLGDGFCFHNATIEPDNFFSSLWGAGTIQINSSHHQAIKDLAPGCRACVTAPDGIVEAFEVPNHPCGLAVQWHPEKMLDDPRQRALFEKFAELAANHADAETH